MVKNNKDSLSGYLERCQKMWALTVHLSWSSIKVAYARSVIGPFWLVLTTGISVLGLGYIWSILFNQDKATFIPSLTIGLVIWQFIANCVNEGPYCFSVHSPIIRNYSHSILVYPVTLVLKNFIIFVHSLVIVALVLALYPQGFGWALLMIFPALLLLLAALIPAVTILAIVGARYKDLGPAVNAFMAIAFFLSPVVFRPGQLGVKAYLMWYNPFSYLITIVRDPITAQFSRGFVYVIVLGFIIVGWLMVRHLLSRYRYRILYWI